MPKTPRNYRDHVNTADNRSTGDIADTRNQWHYYYKTVDTADTS